MKYFISILFLVLLLNCKKETIDNVYLGKDFYPLEVGYWQEYKVDSILFNNFTNPVSVDTFSFFLKEEIESTYKDLNNDLNYRVVRSKKSDSSAYTINHVISVKSSSTNIQKVENDLRFIKLVFPIKKDKTWNGNIYIDALDEPSLDFYNPNKFNWEYVYTDVYHSYEINGFSFDSCVTVIQIDDENLFEKKYSKEIYAKNVGLVYKELLILETQAAPSNHSFIERAENGFILKYSIVDFKK